MSSENLKELLGEELIRCEGKDFIKVSTDEITCNHIGKFVEILLRF